MSDNDELCPRQITPAPYERDHLRQIRDFDARCEAIRDRMAKDPVAVSVEYAEMEDSIRALKARVAELRAKC